MNILFAASEAYPFFTSGGLGDVAGSLPVALKNEGANVCVILPLYANMQPELRKKLEFVTAFTAPVGWRSQYCGLFTLVHKKVTYYFLDNEYYFKRAGLYGFYDDGERFAFFSRALLETLSHIEFVPDIIHCHDWQTALVPVYLNLFYRHIKSFAQIKTVFTIHNIQYQGIFGKEVLEETLSISSLDGHILEYDGIVNFMKGAIETADRISTVSESYASEILDPWYAHGLDAFLRSKQYKLCGILNGIDTSVYSPAKDPALAKNYTIKTFKDGKAACKKALRSEFNLIDNNAPIVGLVTRLVSHKGMDLMRLVADNLLNAGIQLVMLGTGDLEYEQFFEELAARWGGMFGLHLGFVPSLAHKIYAGSDMFLMPSKSEPCGLAQMVSLRYGTIPIVRETGGLKDSIKDSGDGKGNGFTFANYNAYDMQAACLRAKKGYENVPGWDILIKRAMQCNFSWKASAIKYMDMYTEVTELW